MKVYWKCTEKKDEITYNILQGYKMKGKNFSCNNTGHRKQSDFYETPYSLTQLLLNVEKLKEPILEPACGKGAIKRVLKLNGYTDITAYDILKGKDFLKEIKHYTTIITNPPYSLSMKFIEQAKKLSDEFYFLLPLTYLHGIERYEKLYKKPTFPLRKIYVFTRYPMLGEPLRSDGKINTGMMVYAWFCFSKNYKGNPEISWLDINKYILSKRDKNTK